MKRIPVSVAATFALLVAACGSNDTGGQCPDGTNCADVGEDVAFDAADVQALDLGGGDTVDDDTVDDDVVQGDVAADIAEDVATPDTRPTDTGPTDTGQDVTPDTTGPDRDGDGVADGDDAFPDDPTEWIDTDGDNVGDNSDACPNDPNDAIDTDGDGVCDNADACPDDLNDSLDTDGDGYCDGADACPNDVTDWEDFDLDGVCDNADACPGISGESVDSDGDGVCDGLDDFPDNPNEDTDTDGDGTGDNADDDDDGDGLSDIEETTTGADCIITFPNRADSDDDGIDDPQDPYPLDPFPDFLIRGNDAGTLDLFLSNRDGTFRAPVQVGESIAHDATPLNYTGISVGDFDNDGRIDFVAHSSVLVAGSLTRNFYFFWRDVKEDEFNQRLVGTTDAYVGGTILDANNDLEFDIARIELVRAGNLASGQLFVYLNQNFEADCVWSESAADNCFFTRMPPVSVTSAVNGQWTSRMAGQAVSFNPNDDGFVDLTMVAIANGGNADTRVSTLFGDGAGGFTEPVYNFTHNDTGGQAPGNTILFSDLDNDGNGDIFIGFDDDGAAGDSWTYLGNGDGTFSTTPIAAVDLNPTNASESGGGERLGRTGSGQLFDVDFDGTDDLFVGYNHLRYDTAGETRLYMGNGDGTFGPAFQVIGDASLNAHAFAIPRRLCPTFSTGG